ncbi:glutamine synthetase family protein [Streptomyces atriruber]|uniref:glutamine synthetase family protein n=1 Tax=Streptomyces atriruber TaxID=545121 RepID=UPI0006E1D07C|nr:glutamine synthetase family protein [Streptomyces atriruber]
MADVQQDSHDSAVTDEWARILAAVEQQEIEFTRFFWVDHNGITRGKAVSRTSLRDRMSSGIGLAKTRQASNLSDLGQPVPGFDAVGEVRLVPDPRTFIPLPYAAGAAAMLCDLVDIDGRPWAACPRTFLKEAIQACEPLTVRAAFEAEFTLCRKRPEPNSLEVLDDTLCFDARGFDVTHDYATSLARALQQQGIDVELYHPEFGAGQHEMTLRHDDALRAADSIVWHRLTARALAEQHGMWATFAPVPSPGFRGNGNHLHLSLWDDAGSRSDRRNVFAEDSDRLGLSKTARHFVGGLLAHLPALVALGCASVNSYRRLRPGMWSGAYACYGQDNREAAVRIPSRLRGSAVTSTNIEVKVGDSTANPYLLLGAILHAGLDGINNALDPGPPLQEDPNLLSPSEQERRGIRRLPRSLAEAVDALEEDEVLMSALGPMRGALYPSLKRADIAYMDAMGTEFEFLTHALRY